MLPPNGKVKSDVSCEGKPHILKSLAFSFFYVFYLLFLLLRLAELERIGREAKTQSTSKITLAQQSKLHPIKTLNSMLIIMFPIVPFHQGFQSQIYNSSIMLWTFLILIAGKTSCFSFYLNSRLRILTEFDGRTMIFAFQICRPCVLHPLWPLLS